MEARVTASGSSGRPSIEGSDPARAKVSPSAPTIHIRRSNPIHCLKVQITGSFQGDFQRSAPLPRRLNRLVVSDAKRGAQSSRELYARGGLAGRVRWDFRN